MAKQARGRTREFVRDRFSKSRKLQIEQVFGKLCNEVEREDELLYIRRTEKVEHSDGVTSKDIHEDAFCYNKAKCTHVVERTEYEGKVVNYFKCPHSP